MKKPDYRWVCHNCKKVNQPGTGNCIKCGHAAITSATELERTRTVASREQRASNIVRDLPTPQFSKNDYWMTLSVNSAWYAIAPFLLALGIHSMHAFLIGFGLVTLVMFGWPDRVHRYIWEHNKAILLIHAVIFILLFLTYIIGFTTRGASIIPPLVLIGILGLGPCFYLEMRLSKRVNWKEQN